MPCIRAPRTVSEAIEPVDSRMISGRSTRVDHLLRDGDEVGLGEHRRHDGLQVDPLEDDLGEVEAVQDGGDDGLEVDAFEDDGGEVEAVQDGGDDGLEVDAFEDDGGEVEAVQDGGDDGLEVDAFEDDGGEVEAVQDGGDDGLEVDAFEDDGGEVEAVQDGGDDGLEVDALDHDLGEVEPVEHDGGGRPGRRRRGAAGPAPQLLAPVRAGQRELGEPVARLQALRDSGRAQREAEPGCRGAGRDPRRAGGQAPDRCARRRGRRSTGTRRHRGRSCWIDVVIGGAHLPPPALHTGPPLRWITLIG